MGKTAQKLGFYATPPHACSYLPDRQAITLFADPVYPKNRRLYGALLDNGFRRSGEHLYQPYCRDCAACIPVRIPVNQFRPSRNQARTWKRNQDIVVRPLAAAYRQQHFDLYRRYIAARHEGGGMDNPEPDSYMEFLTASWADTRFFEMRLEDKLLAVAVVDRVDNALSSVYTFFDPDYASRSPGKFAILYSIQEARKAGLTWLYLGYWIASCRKMNYKNKYQPVEYYIDGKWRTRPGTADSLFAR